MNKYETQKASGSSKLKTIAGYILIGTSVVVFLWWFINSLMADVNWFAAARAHWFELLRLIAVLLICLFSGRSLVKKAKRDKDNG